MRTAAFTRTDDKFCLKPGYKNVVEFTQQDIRETIPTDHFTLILCRNLVFTYFDEALQEKILRQLHDCLIPHGWLVLGVHEKLPADSIGFKLVSERLGLYQQVGDSI